MATSSLVATVGGASANTYCTLAEANQYHDDRPADAAGTWALATDDQKNKALLWAARLLDTLYEWTGHVVNETQAMLWPRYGMWYPNEFPVASDEIPRQLKWAQAEWAKSLLSSDLAADAAQEAAGVSSLTAGPVSVTFNEPRWRPVPDVVRNMLPPEWGCPRSGKNTLKVVRA